MRLEHEAVAELSGEVLRVIGTYLDLSEYEVFFFGSRVAGGTSPRSDIDCLSWSRRFGSSKDRRAPRGLLI